MPATAMTLSSKTAPSSPDAIKSQRTPPEFAPSSPPPADFSSEVRGEERSERRIEEGGQGRGRREGVAYLQGKPVHRHEESAGPDSIHTWCSHNLPRCGTCAYRGRGLRTSHQEDCCSHLEPAGSCAVPRRSSRLGRSPETWAWLRLRARMWSPARIGEDLYRPRLRGGGLTDEACRLVIAQDSPAVTLAWLALLTKPPPRTPEGGDALQQ